MYNSAKQTGRLRGNVRIGGPRGHPGTASRIERDARPQKWGTCGDGGDTENRNWAVKKGERHVRTHENLRAGKKSTLRKRKRKGGGVRFRARSRETIYKEGGTP